MGRERALVLPLVPFPQHQELLLPLPGLTCGPTSCNPPPAAPAGSEAASVQPIPEKGGQWGLVINPNDILGGRVEQQVLTTPLRGNRKSLCLQNCLLYLSEARTMLG